jgi:hypothetical protein
MNPTMETTTKNTGKFAKGNPGKPKGATNKVNNDIKSMILAALSSAGGAEYLERKANDPRTAAAFLGLIGKVLPMTVAGDPDAPLRMIHRVELVPMRGDSTS